MTVSVEAGPVGSGNSGKRFGVANTQHAVDEGLVAQDDFRAAMGAIASPVSVVTSFAGVPHGTTVSAFCSLSLEPPMILVSLQRDSDLLKVLSASGRFGLNVLAHGQSAIAATFASRGLDRFEAVDWWLHDGVPRLAGTASWTGCWVADIVAAGDHVIVTGLVTTAEHSDLAGLVYQHRTFGEFSAQ